MRSASEIWETAKGSLQVQVNKANYETWLKDTVGVSYQGNRFVIGTPKAFAKEWLEKRLLSLVKKTLIGIVGQEVEVHFEVSPAPGRATGDKVARHPSPAPTQARLPLHKLNPKWTFGSFVVSVSNRLPYAAALGVAEDPGHEYNPLFMYGGPGVGKSHLAHAIGNEAIDSGLCVAYASAEQFTTDFVNAIKAKTVDQFRQKFRVVDLFIIEDIEFLLGKQQTLSSLFHICDELHNGNRQVVITGNRPPQSMASLQSELSSRLECGLITRVHPPDLETRIAILKAKAVHHQIQIDKAALEFIAQQCHTNVRKLEGLLNRSVAYSKMLQRNLSLDVARESLQAITHESSPSPSLTPTSILQAVSDHFQVSPQSLSGKQRDADLALARQMAIYLIREKTGCPLQDIGRLLGGRNHSTVLRSYQKTSQAMTSDRAIHDHASQILQLLTQ